LGRLFIHFEALVEKLRGLVEALYVAVAIGDYRDCLNAWFDVETRAKALAGSTEAALSQNPEGGGGQSQRSGIFFNTAR
jgi:hypothetical protein